MIILESLMIDIEESYIFEVADAVVKIGSSLKLNHHEQI